MSATQKTRPLMRDRIVVTIALVVLTALAWGYVLWLAADMDMGGMDMTGFRMIPAGIGIMAPANAPWGAITRVGRQAAAGGKPFAATGWFAGGYFLAWIGFSLVATLAQWVLERAALLDVEMASTSGVLGGAILIAAGIYQWTPLKEVCLAQCQTPLLFLMRHGGFRQEALGCLHLGLRHGAYCIGCCWVLMALLFVGGVMNVLWIALLALLILFEKLFRFGRWIARASGIVFLAAGTWLLFLKMT